MAHLLVLEQLYPEMEEATVGRWLIAEGDTVQADQPVAELITDKVAYEYRSPAAGTILVLLTSEKSVAPVGTVLAVAGAANEPIDNLQELLERNRRLANEREAQLRAVRQATVGEEAAAPAASRPGGVVRATPAARRLARERGVDLAAVRGSGPGGMVTIDDIP